jgi:hypothetical protein
MAMSGVIPMKGLYKDYKRVIINTVCTICKVRQDPGTGRQLLTRGGRKAVMAKRITTADLINQKSFNRGIDK